MLFFVILFLGRISLTLSYDSQSFGVKLKYLPFVIWRYPEKKKSKLQKVKTAKVKPKKEKKADSSESKSFKDMLPGNLDEFRRLLPDVLALLKKFFGYFRCKKIMIDYVAGGGDAFATAMQFGGAYNAAELIYHEIAPSLGCKNRKISVRADFLATAPAICFLAEISIALWQIFAFAFSALRFYFAKLRPLADKE